MFVLKKQGTDHEKFVLVPIKSSYSVGRLGTDLLLKEDLSVSRTHAILHLPKAEHEPLRIEDLGSTFGTFLNENIKSDGKKMKSKSTAVLKMGDKVRFGVSNVWEVTQLKLITATSALSPTASIELEQSIKLLNGTIAQNWTNQCTHLTMTDLSVTVKLLLALLDHKPIVNTKFWQAFVKAARLIHVREPWPRPEDFEPVQLHSIDIKWRSERTKLFAGKTFVFMSSKHLETYSLVVQKAGGAFKDLNSGVRKTFLTKKDVVVVQYVPSTQSQGTETINSITEILERSGSRVIPEYEIGMAILHCSIEKYCNPWYKFKEEMMSTTQSMTASENISANTSIIVPNTVQPVNVETGTTTRATEVIVPESEEIECLTTSSEKQSTELKQSAKQRESIARVTRKRSHAMFVDSSDEDLDDNENETKKSRASGVRTKPNISTKSTAIIDLNNKQLKIVEQQKAPPPTTRNKPTAAAQANHVVEKEDDAELFQYNSNDKSPFSECPETSVRANTRSAVKSLPNVQINRPTKISVRNFLEKSQQQIAPENLRNSIDSQADAKSRKRVHIEVLNESDCDDDDLFNFGDSKRAKNTKNARTSNGNESGDENDGLFNFREETDQDNSDVEAVNEDSMDTQPFVPDKGRKSKYVLPQPKQIPRKINISGWLSCSGLHDDVKQELNVSDSATVQEKVEGVELLDTLNSVKQEIEDKDDTDTLLAHKKWLASIKDGIQVRLGALNITSNRPLDQTDAGNGQYSGRKNFKKFTKQRCLHPQKSIVEVKRLQLVEGMVMPV
ncbi:nibrin [Scaptodrosophila lebanonensis]|uniref:Nibrin n=1 Tax=Drosophila lebanonensis TaxID=7225 RepID=A0A6J2T604_DROLE|nr:nibrin [Scaptodrosophila lebanonensis]